MFPLLLGVMFCGVMGFAQAKNAIPTEQSKSVASAGKTSSSNIHIDEIVIKTPSTQSGNLPISKDEYEILVSKLSNDAQEDFISWCKRQGLIISIFGLVLIIAVLRLIWDSVNKAIEDSVKESVKELLKTEIDRSTKFIDNTISSFDKKREQAIEITEQVKVKINLAQETIEELQNTGNELKDKQNEFQEKVSEEIKNKEKEIIELNSKTEEIKNEQKAFNDDLRSKTESEIPQLEQKINALERIINIIDKEGSAKKQVVNDLIKYLYDTNLETRYEVAEFLPRFDPESIPINEAFLDILKTKNPDKIFRPILLSGLGKLARYNTLLAVFDDDSSNHLSYLLNLVENMNDPDILAIIGALGEIGETADIGEIGKIGKSKITDTELESIIDKLLSILNDDLDNKFSEESEITASDIRGAIALAFSYYRKKAAKAVDVLKSLLDDKKPETCINTCIALGRIGVQDAIPALQKLINNEDTWDEVKKAALEAIEEIKNQN